MAARPLAASTFCFLSLEIYLMNKNITPYLALVVAVVLMAMISLIPASAAPAGAPAAAVTPVTFANNSSRTMEGARLITFFNGTPAAYNTPTTNCFDTRSYNTMDVVYTLGSVAAITVEQVYGNDTTVLAPGASLIANNATPVVTPAAVQIPNFNAYNCIKVTSVNGTPVSVYVKALGK
jgi:hypothetical protein